MPPAAISRSSTYLPKIWGNIARLHRSALGLVLLLSGCSGPSEPRVLPIRAERPEGCGNGDPTTIQLEALGDFEASTLSSETVTEHNPQGTPLAFPAQTLAIEARGEGSGTTFLGLGEVDPGGGIDLLLLPEDAACELYRPGSNKPYPLATGGESIGFSRAHDLLLVAGGLAPSGDSARALVMNVDTAVATEVEGGMLPGRAFATITEFGPDALLVAGGIDPSASPAPAIGTAIVFDIAEQRFDRTRLIQLPHRRARHAAVVLESGDTLLIGGVDESAWSALEAISPVDRAARLDKLAELSEARIAPTAFRLEDGRVFVGGGERDDGSPAQKLEWLSPTAEDRFTLDDVRVASESAFVAMSGSSVLAVGVCRPGASSEERPECVPGRIERQVAWIRADHTLDTLPPLPFVPGGPMLVPAADGRPFLIATTPSGERVVLRFDPWTGLFAPPDEAPIAPGVTQPAPIATDPGMFVWLAPFGDALRIQAFRHGTRGTYSRDIAPLLATGPQHVVPDRAPIGGSGIAYSGALELDGDGSANPPRARVADTAYDELTLEIVIANGEPPRIALGAALFGGPQCPWPSGGSELVLRRTGGSVTLERGGDVQTCTIAPGRVSVSLVAPSDGSARVQSVRVSRGAR